MTPEEEVERLRMVLWEVQRDLATVVGRVAEHGRVERAKGRIDGALREARNRDGLTMWCPVCKTMHRDVGERSDAGAVTRPCPRIPADDPRNRP